MNERSLSVRLMVSSRPTSSTTSISSHKRALPASQDITLVHEPKQSMSLKRPAADFNDSPCFLVRHHSHFHHEPFISFTEATSSISDADEDDVDDDAVNMNIHRLIDRALNVAFETDDDDDSLLEDDFLLEEGSLGSYEDFTVDSLILTRQRMANLCHLCSNEYNSFARNTVLTVTMKSLKEDEHRLVSIVGKARLQQEPPPHRTPEEARYDSTKRARRMMKPNNSMELTRKRVPPSRFADRIEGSRSENQPRGESSLPALVRLDTDEMLPCEDDLSDDGSLCSYRNDLLQDFDGNDDPDDFDPFFDDDEIDSIVVNKRRLVKRKEDGDNDDSLSL
ncbi:hypothetical protein IV203_038175 [Nitzschia inconspicua]|uniref:Uncharacterized protein n=1 Tax=Nitzschia inconspicua TaxID=303405 RepID=A0A9K3LMS1_9STRA|nr:hypothetical protein IV203_038175 [Nitzschia inconspicua]